MIYRILLAGSMFAPFAAQAQDGKADAFVLQSCLDAGSLVFSLASIGFDPPPKERQSEILDDFARAADLLGIAGGARTKVILENQSSDVRLLEANAFACFQDEPSCSRSPELLSAGYSASGKFRVGCEQDYLGN